MHNPLQALFDDLLLLHESQAMKPDSDKETEEIQENEPESETKPEGK